MTELFRDRVAFITGGASGIGRAVARALAARGSHLVLADIDEAALADAVSELGASARVLGVRTDVRDRKSVEAARDATLSEFGRVHIVCNNAGIAPFGRLVDAEPSDWEITMGINFFGVVNGVDAFLPHLLEHDDGGHIVNTASMAGLVGMEYLGMYCASKFAVVGLTESLYRELRDSSVGASVLCPMIVRTDIGANSRRMLEGGVASPPQGESTGQGLVQGAVIGVEEVAARVVRGIERRDLYIITHGDQREILRRRAARQDAMFEAEAFEL